MTDHFAVASDLARRVHDDSKQLAVEYAKPVGYRDTDRINQLHGRTGRLMKRAEVHALLALSQRLDDLGVKL